MCCWWLKVVVQRTSFPNFFLNHKLVAFTPYSFNRTAAQANECNERNQKCNLSLEEWNLSQQAKLRQS